MFSLSPEEANPGTVEDRNLGIQRTLSPWIRAERVFVRSVGSNRCVKSFEPIVYKSPARGSRIPAIPARVSAASGAFSRVPKVAGIEREGAGAPISL